MLGQFDPVISQAVDIRGFYFLLAITLQVAITRIYIMLGLLFSFWQEDRPAIQKSPTNKFVFFIFLYFN